MNEVCRSGTAYLIQLQAEQQDSLKAALMQSHTSKGEDGMNGIPLPYQLRSDWVVTGILFLCFILASYVLAHGKRHLKQQFKNFASSKERGSLFDEGTAPDVHYTLALILQTCILLGFCCYDYFSDHSPHLFSMVSHALLLGTYIGSIVFFFVIKWLLFGFVNWIFFNKIKSLIWQRAYFNIVIGAGFLLFPIVLLIVYFDLSPQIAPYFVGFVIIIAKILLLYKCFSNFFNKIYGSFHLILYFCALEILPDFVLWKGIILANNCWF